MPWGIAFGSISRRKAWCEENALDYEEFETADLFKILYNLCGNTGFTMAQCEVLLVSPFAYKSKVRSLLGASQRVHGYLGVHDRYAIPTQEVEERKVDIQAY